MAQEWRSNTSNNNPASSSTTQAQREQSHLLDQKLQTRTIPPWTLTPDLSEYHEKQRNPHSIQRPQSPVIPHHHYLPEAQRERGKAAKGRRWDYLRNAEPALLDQTLQESSGRWIPAMISGPQYLNSEVAGATHMSDDWMEENVPFWTTEPDLADEDRGHEKRRSFLMDLAMRGRRSTGRSRSTLLKNPFVPLVVRTITTVFSLAALGLGVHVYRLTKHLHADDGSQCQQRASTYLSIIVDAVAVPYTIYVTRDEYTSKPLGLRSATAKVALLLLDLYFIVFYSSNLSLAFDALTDTRWACYESSRNQTCPKDTSICNSQSSLTAVLVVALIAWIVTFSISVLRVVKRLRPDES